MSAQVTYVDWLENYAAHPYKMTTIKRYVAMLETAPEKLNSSFSKGIMEISDLDEFENAFNAVTSHEEYDHYFLKFSNEYMRIHDITEFENNWYEFVEYGTTNPVTIILQRHEFSREAATYIKDNHPEWIVPQQDGTIKLRRDALESANENTRVEANQANFNSPDLFEPAETQH